ncbi:hypothetical protein [Butyrivibrio sp. VCB2001]|uniref:hypothetical protein n=1 Tax=Butyrivibrio sp. VCB2001 TaxID=1280667 RepID=UPI0003FAA979|nr:hypothetical protein [Butyrivibrio sp. VCB2001]
MIKKIVNFLEKKYSLICITISWWLFCRSNSPLGVYKGDRKERIIVSLTSYPGRINYVFKTIQSLLLQVLKPDRIILWLSQEQFKGLESELPHELLELKNYGLEIRWCKDTKSYKKLIPAVKEWPKDIIVTADDDTYYRKKWLLELYEAHLKNPKDICAHRVTKIVLIDNEYKTIVGGVDVWNFACYLNKLTGVGGVLYPPGCFYKDLFREDIFMKKCTTNDDVWFWLMGVLNGTKVFPVRKSFSKNILTVKGSQTNGALCKINDYGDMLFWKDFFNMLKEYPELDSILRDEYRSIIETTEGA